MLKFIFYFILFSLILSYLRRLMNSGSSRGQNTNQQQQQTSQNQPNTGYFANKRKKMETDLAEDAEYEEVK